MSHGFVKNNLGSNSFQIDASGGTSDTYGVLAGTIDGANKVFTTSKSTYITGNLTVYLNGQLQTQGSSEDWVETAPGSGTFTFDVAPVAGDEIITVYQYGLNPLANSDTLDSIHGSATAEANKFLALDADKDLHLGTGDIEATDARLKKLEVNQTVAADIEDIRDNGTVVRKMYDGGIMDLPKQSGCRVRLTSDQAIPTDIWTKMALATEDWDIQNEYDSVTTYRFTATKAGKYQVNLQGYVDTLADTDNYSIAIKKNGAFSSCFSANNVAATISASVSASDIVELAVGDYISAWFIHRHGSSRNLSADIWNNYLSIVKIQ